MTEDTEDRVDPGEYIHETFRELRRLYDQGHAEQIRREVSYMTECELHRPGSGDCLAAARGGDAYVYGTDEDVISEHLHEGNELTDDAAEAIVRRLAGTTSVLERAHFDGWLRIFGFEPLTGRK